MQAARDKTSHALRFHVVAERISAAESRDYKRKLALGQEEDDDDETMKRHRRAISPELHSAEDFASLFSRVSAHSVTAEPNAARVTTPRSSDLYRVESCTMTAATRK